jgi:hypothetical protein
MLIGLLKSRGLLDRPRERRPQRFPRHVPTGLADGHQPMERPFLRTALLQLAHEQTVRQHDQVHVPGLALNVTQLTVTQPVLLFVVPMGGLRACSAMEIHPHDPTHFPSDPIRHQDLAARPVFAVMGVPQSSEQKRTLSRADCQAATVIGVTQRPQFTLSDAVGQRKRIAPQDVDVLVTKR